MPTTSNFGWNTPADTDLVKDGAAAIRTLGNNIDASFLDLKGGTSGQVLAKNSNTDLDFVWVAQDDANAIQNSIVDAKGDLISATANDTPARLAVGTNGQVLTANSATSTGLEWTTLSTGSYTLISTTTLTGASVSLTSIPATYTDLVLVIRNFRPATDGFGLGITLNSDTGSAYFSDQTSAASSNQPFGTTFRFGSNNQDNGTSQAFHRASFYDYANTTTWKVIEILSVINNATTTANNELEHNKAVTNITAAISSIQIFARNGNLDAGTALLYGVR